MASQPSTAATRPFSSTDVVDVVRESFEDALGRAELIERDLLVAGRLVRLQFAGPELVAAYEPPIAHLLVTDGQPGVPSLTLRVWDAASTGSRPIPLPPGAMHRGESGIRYHGDADGVVVHAADSTLSVLDAAAGTAWHYVPDASGLLWYQRAAPWKDLVHAWARGQGLVLVHAAAVGRPEGGLLIVGKAGSGKSTTSLACLRAGLAFAGDDYVLVDVDRTFVHSLYSSAKLEWSHLDRHPDLFRPANSRADAKALAFLAHDAADRVVDGFDVLGLALPAISDRDDTRATLTTAADALLRLAPSTILQTPGQSQPALAAMSELVARVPAYRLELGRDVTTIPAALDAVIHDLRDR